MSSGCFICLLHLWFGYVFLSQGALDKQLLNDIWCARSFAVLGPVSDSFSYLPPSTRTSRPVALGLIIAATLYQCMLFGVFAHCTQSLSTRDQDLPRQIASASLSLGPKGYISEPGIWPWRGLGSFRAARPTFPFSKPHSTKVPDPRLD